MATSLAAVPALKAGSKDPPGLTSEGRVRDSKSFDSNVLGGGANGATGGARGAARGVANLLGRDRGDRGLGGNDVGVTGANDRKRAGRC